MNWATRFVLCDAGRVPIHVNITGRGWPTEPCRNAATTRVVSRCADGCGQPACDVVLANLCGEHARRVDAVAAAFAREARG